MAFAGLEVKPPLPPMEAKTAESVPAGEKWQYEPKWDGFRCLIFRDGDEVELQSKATRPLGRYFPEMVEAVRRYAPRRCVLDGELVIQQGDALSFDALQLRLHPAESRVRTLARETPASLVLFDCLEKKKPLIDRPLDERRRALEALEGEWAGSPFRLSPVTLDRDAALAWLASGGTMLDGVVAKRRDHPYRSGERAMVKVKNIRTADCVVGGFRYASAGREVGSLLLGLYGDDGALHHVGFTSAIRAEDKAELTKRLEKMVEPPGFTGRAPGGPSRWSNARSAEWQPLKPVLVVEVRYDHVTGERFRHGTGFLRWRPDKAPEQCRMDQLEPPASPDRLAEALAGAGSEETR